MRWLGAGAPAGLPWLGQGAQQDSVGGGGGEGGQVGNAAESVPSRTGGGRPNLPEGRAGLGRGCGRQGVHWSQGRMRRMLRSSREAGSTARAREEAQPWGISGCPAQKVASGSARAAGDRRTAGPCSAHGQAGELGGRLFSREGCSGQSSPTISSPSPGCAPNTSVLSSPVTLPPQPGQGCPCWPPSLWALS